MNAPPFPSNPAVGQTWQNWTWNGCTWVANAAAPALRVVVQTFPVSAPYMPSAGLVSGVVECFGPGGAGGGVANPQGVLTYVLGGGGGGSGGYSRYCFQQSQVLGGVVVTVGAGGLGSPNGVGGDGGVTSFGALCVANGGSGGRNCDATTSAGGGGNLALSGIGDIAFPGSAGLSGTFLDLANGSWYTASTALGGWIFGGNSGEPEVPSGVGLNGQSGWGGTGAGGSGAVMNQLAAGSFAGGPGASGLCVVTEYCWADAASGDPCCPPGGGARVAWPGPGPCPQGWGYDD